MVQLDRPRLLSTRRMVICSTKTALAASIRDRRPCVVMLDAKNVHSWVQDPGCQKSIFPPDLQCCCAVLDSWSLTPGRAGQAEFARGCVCGAARADSFRGCWAHWVGVMSESGGRGGSLVASSAHCTLLPNPREGRGIASPIAEEPPSGGDASRRHEVHSHIDAPEAVCLAPTWCVPGAVPPPPTRSEQEQPRRVLPARMSQGVPLEARGRRRLGSAAVH